MTIRRKDLASKCGKWSKIKPNVHQSYLYVKHVYSIYFPYYFILKIV